MRVEAVINRVETISIPAQAAGIEGVFNIHAFKWLAVPTVCGGIAEHALDVLHLGTVVTATFAQERTPNIAIQVNRLACTGILGNLKDQYRMTSDVMALFNNFYIMIEFLIGMQNG